jgi:integrase
MALVQAHGRMRPQDVCRMRRGDLSTRPGERVEYPSHPGRYAEAWSVDRVPLWVYVPRDHKTAWLGKPRAVPLGPKTRAILYHLIERLKPSDYVFDPRRDGPAKHPCYATGVYAARIARVIRRANAPLVWAGVPAEHLIPHWFPNQLRHLQATAVGDRLDREHAKALLGHSAGGDEIDRYMEQSLGKAGRAAVTCE